MQWGNEIMKQHIMSTNVTEARTRKEIEIELRKWKDVGEFDFPVPSEIGSRRAVCRFVLAGNPVVIDCDSQPSYRQNLRAIYYAIWSMRMNEKRGISDTLRKAYLQLEGPGTRKRDPYEVLGVRPDIPFEDIEAMYKIKAKRSHPDVGGSNEAMQELNEAWEEIQLRENNR